MKLVITLARYGGLRCPSEIQALEWCDIDWDKGRIKVKSPKTEHHGKSHRVIPLFPELIPLLREAHDSAEDKAGFVITKYRNKNANLRTQFKRILTQAGITPWERLFQNLRTSRQNELADEYPMHVVIEWMGNSELVALKHYLKVKESHFREATRAKTSAVGDESVPKSTPQVEAAKSTEEQEPHEGKALTSETVADTGLTKGQKVPPRGVEPLFSG
ncbi:hypothetical protein DTL42_11745 [Bremerella cremea]|uniref:Tyr recombinase domain-containing protein n=2 Tax=Bremerella cremea TaxID=1031537 RepID=A0A368KTQ6_9BACT|nr:hypothetical protein DTL42_11745 [Bremerella cremea]